MESPNRIITSETSRLQISFFTFSAFLCYNAKAHWQRTARNFYCLYNKKINIAVTSNLKVASNNADKIKDNTYIWTIDKNTTDIELVVDKNTPYTKPIKRGISSTFRIVCFIVLVVLSSLAYILYKKKNSSEI